MVSIICFAYNHEKFIRDTLEGIVNQKTIYKYEIIIHDDASTDSTADIIREYEAKYPNLFVCIYQTENQYSKGTNIENTFCYPIVRGKYTAICECDDYWCDENKLQKQVDFLESHEDYVACAHTSRVLDFMTGDEYLYHEASEDETLSLHDIIHWGGNKRYSTCTVLYRSEYNVRPKEFLLGIIGDYPRALYLALSGKIYFMKDPMAVYRTCTHGSWTESYETSRSFKLENIEAVCKMLGDIDDYSDRKYHDLFEMEQMELRYPILLEENRYSEIYRDYKKLWKTYSFKSTTYIFLASHFPKLFGKLVGKTFK